MSTASKRKYLRIIRPRFIWRATPYHHGKCSCLATGQPATAGQHVWHAEDGLVHGDSRQTGTQILTGAAVKGKLGEYETSST